MVARAAHISGTNMAVLHVFGTMVVVNFVRIIWSLDSQLYVQLLFFKILSSPSQALPKDYKAKKNQSRSTSPRPPAWLASILPETEEVSDVGAKQTAAPATKDQQLKKAPKGTTSVPKASPIVSPQQSPGRDRIKFYVTTEDGANTKGTECAANVSMATLVQALRNTAAFKECDTLKEAGTGKTVTTPAELKQGNSYAFVKESSEDFTVVSNIYFTIIVKSVLRYFWSCIQCFCLPLRLECQMKRNSNINPKQWESTKRTNTSLIHFSGKTNMKCWS